MLMMRPEAEVVQDDKANTRLHALSFTSDSEHHAASLCVATAPGTCDDTSYLAEAYEQVNAGLLPFPLRLLPSSGTGCSKPLRYRCLHAVIQGRGDACSYSLLEPLCYSRCHSLIQALGNSHGHLHPQAGGYCRVHRGSQLCCEPGLYLGLDVQCRGGRCAGACVWPVGGSECVSSFWVGR